MINSILISGAENLWSFKRDEIIAKVLRLKPDELTNFLQSTDFRLIGEEGKISWGIEEVRELQKEINLRPSHYSLRIYQLNHAEKLTIQAQNAFLKTLEEHPEYSLLILCTTNFNLLLPTVLSRCQKILLPHSNLEFNSEENEEFLSLLKTLFNKQQLGHKFKLAEESGQDKIRATNFLESLILLSRQLLLENSSELPISRTKLLQFLRNCDQTKKHLNANVNPRFALENLFLSC